jgi:hypothetical protein
MTIGVAWAEGVWEDASWAVGVWQQDLGDTTLPTVVLISTISDGDELRIRFSEEVTFGLGGNGGFTANMSGGAATLTYASGDGTLALIYTWSRTIEETESGTLAYTQPGDGVEDLAGNDLDTFTNFTISAWGGSGYRKFSRLINRSLARLINRSIN